MISSWKLSCRTTCATEYWKTCLAKARRYASAETECAKEIARMMKAMADAQNLVQKLVSVKQALAFREEMKGQLRDGALAKFEGEMVVHLKAIAQAVLQSDAKNAVSSVAIDCDWLSAALASLPVPGGSDVPGIIVDLKKWREANLVVLTSRELAELCDRSREDVTNFDIAELQRLCELLVDSGTEAVTKNVPIIHMLMAIMMQQLQEKARCVYY